MRVLLIIILTLGSHLVGRGAEVADSVAAADSACVSAGVPGWVPGMVGGGVMTASALVGRYAYPRHYDVADRRVRPDRGTDYLQYAPLALPWVMKLAGQPTRSGWGRMAVSQGVATAVMVGVVKGLKSGVKSMRPDGSDYNSFPSGHSAWAFMGATMVAKELGWRSPWYGIGAYALATGIAVERVVDGHHQPVDVMAGAGIGIMAAELGYFIGDLMFKNCQIDCREKQGLRLNDNFSYLALETGLSLPLGRISAGDAIVERMPALSAGLRGGWAIDDNWGLGVEIGLLKTPLILNVKHDRTYVKNLSSLGVFVSPYYSYVVSNHISLTGEVGVGYYHQFALNALENGIEAGSGTPAGRVGIGAVVRMSEHFSAKATVGYEVSGYKFTLHPSSAYHTTESVTTRGVTSALLVNISSRYEF